MSASNDEYQQKRFADEPKTEWTNQDIIDAMNQLEVNLKDYREWTLYTTNPEYWEDLIQKAMVKLANEYKYVNNEK